VYFLSFIPVLQCFLFCVHVGRGRGGQVFCSGISMEVLLCTKYFLDKFY
jgi:hypothetical protein